MQCAVAGCTNNTQKLNKWKSEICPVHGCNQGSSQCACEPPFVLHPCPGGTASEEWKGIVGRTSLQKRNCDIRVCSFHFVDGQSVSNNPNPTMSLGHSEKRSDDLQHVLVTDGATLETLDMSLTQIKEELSETEGSEDNTDMNFASSDATPDLRRTLLQFQNDGYLCDTELVGTDGRVKVHGVVLAAASNMFRKALKSEADDSTVQHTIVLQGVELCALKVAVYLAYTGEMVIPKEYSSGDELVHLLTVLSKLGLSFPAELEHSSRCFAADIAVTPDVANTVESEIAEVKSKENGITSNNKTQLSKKRLKRKLVAENSVSRYKDRKCVSKRETKGLYSSPAINLPDPEASPSTVDKSQRQKSSVKDRTGTKRKCHSRKLLSAKDSSLLGDDVAPTAVQVPSDDTVDCNDGADRQAVGASRREVNLCEICGQTFDESHKLGNHKTTHGGELRPFKCEECGKEYRYKGNLKEHFAKEHLGVRVICQHCGNTYRNSWSLHEHLLESHPDLIGSDPKIKPSVCTICGESFARRRVYLVHMKKQHPSPDDPVEFSCQYCGRKYSTSESLRYHIYLKHRELNALVLKDQGNLRYVKAAQARAQSLKARSDKSASKDGFACPICGRRYTLSDSLRVHIRMKHRKWKKTFCCEHCGRDFISPSQLARHATKHTTARPFKCPLCNRQYKDLYGLREHSCAAAKELTVPT